MAKSEDARLNMYPIEGWAMMFLLARFVCNDTHVSLINKVRQLLTGQFLDFFCFQK